MIVFLLSGLVRAEQVPPDEAIQTAVERITQRIDAERDRLEKEPDYARQVINEEMGELVDFRRITRAVMAEHFADASRDQRNRFLQIFRDSLMDTYASGLTLYEGQPWQILPLSEEDIRGDRARVHMEVRTEAGERITVLYMLISDGEQWRVDNVIVNGLNLGRTFRAQFAQAMREHGGDIDRVIDNWSAEVDEAVEDPGEA